MGKDKQIRFEILFYESIDGETPVEDFLDSLDDKMRAKVIGRLEILEEKGNALREPLSKSLGDEIFELRVQQANSKARILYFFYYGAEIILTNGFIKKTSKTPKSEIETAKKRREDYLERKKGVGK